MAVKAVVYNRWYSGWSTDLKVGTKGSFPYSQAFDFRKSPSQLSVLPKMGREDAEVVTGLIQNTVMTEDGTVYAIDNNGTFYRRTTGAVWSAEANLSSGAIGLNIRRDADMMLIASNKTVSRYMPLRNSPAITPDAYGPSMSTYDNSSVMGFNVSSFQDSGVLTYALPSAINESSPNRRSFQTNIEPLSRLDIFVVTPGTGDITATLHDGLDNVLTTVTIANASLTSNNWNSFIFASQVRTYVAPNARVYHWHATSSDGTGTVACTTTNDLSTANMRMWADRLVNTPYHPMVRFQQYETIANGNYLTVWEPLDLDSPTNDEWQRHRLVFPMEYTMIGVATTNEFEVMALAKNSTDPNSTPQAGLIAFWSGTSPTYDFIIPIPEGSPQGLHTYQNTVYYYAGGDLYAISSPVSQPVKLRSMPSSALEYSGTNTPVTVYPYAAAVRRGIHLYAWPSVVASSAPTFGVYSWGQVDKNYPASFGYNYLPSTASQNYSASNNLQLGGCWAYGDLLLLSWRDDLNGGYGIDSVTNASKPATTAVWESLIVDNNFPNKEEQGLYVDAYYSLPSGATLTLAYKLDREATWQTSQAFTSTELWQDQVGYARLNIGNADDPTQRCREIQMQITITCDDTVTTPPVVYSAAIIFDDLKSERLM